MQIVLGDRLTTEHQWAWFLFKLETCQAASRCSECGRKMAKGELAWVSRTSRNTRHVAKGKVAKRVCSVECGQTFDYRAMAHQAWLRRRNAK